MTLIRTTIIIDKIFGIDKDRGLSDALYKMRADERSKERRKFDEMFSN